MLTFHLTYSSGLVVESLQIPQRRFVEETETTIAKVLESDEGDEIVHKFRDLLGISGIAILEQQWEVFKYFTSWLQNGSYKPRRLRALT